MKSKIILKLLSLILILTSCETVSRMKKFYNTTNEIEINKTEMLNVIKLIGQSDDEFEIYSCGRSSGHISGWTTYKKFGLAFHSTSYNPERQDGYKNGIVRNIGIFDTTNLTINRSKQQEIYYDQDFPAISTTSLETVFGKADHIKDTDSSQYYIYFKRQITFVFHKQDKHFLRLYITK